MSPTTVVFYSVYKPREKSDNAHTAPAGEEGDSKTLRKQKDDEK